jgi:hypothetical protein
VLNELSTGTTLPFTLYFIIGISNVLVPLLLNARYRAVDHENDMKAIALLHALRS